MRERAEIHFQKTVIDRVEMEREITQIKSEKKCELISHRVRIFTRDVIIRQII